MRVVFLGAGALAVMTARMLLRHRAEVIFIERDRAVIDALAEELDCGFIHGDGSRPAILREADPANTDVLFCLSGNDQSNIIASLVGRSLGFGRVVTKVDDAEFEHICIELGLEDTIIPTRTIGRYLADTYMGTDLLAITELIKDEARLFAFVAREEEAVLVSELRLPADVRVVCLYRDGKFIAVAGDTAIRCGDEVVLIAPADNLPKLRERWEAQKKGRRH